MVKERKVTCVTALCYVSMLKINFASFIFRISPNIKDAALCTAVKMSNNQITWTQMLNVYMTTKSASEKDSAQSALTCSRDTSLLYKYDIY